MDEGTLRDYVATQYGGQYLLPNANMMAEKIGHMKRLKINETSPAEFTAAKAVISMIQEMMAELAGGGWQ